MVKYDDKISSVVASAIGILKEYRTRKNLYIIWQILKIWEGGSNIGFYSLMRMITHLDLLNLGNLKNWSPGFIGTSFGFMMQTKFWG